MSKQIFDPDKENLRVFIYQDVPKSSDRYGATVSVSLNPPPFISIDTSWNNATGEENDTITLHGYKFFTGSNITDQILIDQIGMRTSLSGSNVSVDINDINGATIKSFTKCILTSLKFEEGTYTQYYEYVATFRHYGKNGTVSENSELQLTWNTDMGFPTNGLGGKTDGYYTAVLSSQIIKPNSYGSPESLSGTVYINETNKTISDASDTSATQFTVFSKRSSGSSKHGEFRERTNSIECILRPISGIDSSYSVLVSFSYGSTSSSNNVFDGSTVGGKIVGLENLGQAQNYFNNVCGETASHIVPNGYNNNPISTTTSENGDTRTVTFNYEYTDRPSNRIDNAKVEKIETKTTSSGDAFSVIPVIGRSHGPILQNAFGTTERKKEITIEVLFYSSGKTAQADTNIDTIISNAKPTGTVFENPRSSTYNSTERRYFTNVSWVYE